MAFFRVKYKKNAAEYYGTASPLSSPRYGLAATTVGNYAIFAGGVSNMSNKETVAYNSFLTKTIVNDTNSYSYLAATTVGNYALFGGGYSSDSSYPTDYVVGYDTSLTKIVPTTLGWLKSNLAATTVGNYALFGGGAISGVSETTYINTGKSVTAYDTSLTRTSAPDLDLCTYRLAATTVGNYALFGGGWHVYSSSGSENSDKVYGYDTSLTRTSNISKFIRARQYLAATTVGNYAIFGGGQTGNYNATAYNASLTKTEVNDNLLDNPYHLAATTVGNYALFGGGAKNSGGYTNSVTIYDISLTRSNNSLSIARQELAATTVGNYALFGGGDSYSSGTIYYDTVDVFTA